ncbi:MAG: toxin co-regulated pilus biosynthesis Q family protein [Alphaproteobacteria bacterium]|nr:toxin co-regulated pilus biosynthesis Q family protein [Alphaproteobacteria bacterium]
MFRKILIFAMFATAAGYCFAYDSMPQVVTSEVFYDQDRILDGAEYEQVETTQIDVQEEYQMPVEVPAWPLAGSDADVEVSCEHGVCNKKKQDDNIRIVSKIGADLVVENNFNLGGRRAFGDWSGGANMLHGNQIPVGFDDECYSSSQMPLLHREVLEDDGGNVLAMSRSGRKNCGKYADNYEAFAVRNGMRVDAKTADGKRIVTKEDGTTVVEEISETVEEETEIMVDASADAEAPAVLSDQVRSWVVANGQTLREVLQSWCDKEGWDLVWTTPREYPIEASAVFKGRFVDVASALVRNFGRATPIPYAKFYKGNRVLVISASQD